MGCIAPCLFYTNQVEHHSSSKSLMSHVRRLFTSRVLLIAILALALALRFYGLAWDDGFGFTPHPDERAILDRVIGVSPPSLGDIHLLFDAEQSPWNPRWFNYGSFPLYVLKAMQIAGSPFLNDANDIRVLGRAVSGLADILTILAVYGIATLVFDRRAGLLAAALTALAVIHIQLSHYFAVDTLQAMLAIAALYFMVRVAREGRIRDSLLAGALVGLGLATKASQLPIIAPFVIAHLMFALGLNGKEATVGFRQRCKVAFEGVVGGGAIAIGALLIAQPYTLLDWGTFFSHVSEQSEMIRGIRDYPYTRQYANTAPYLYHIRQLAVWGYGLPLGIVAWAGLLYISLRGMPLKLGLAYLLVGWALPAGILFASHSAIALMAAAGISLLALLATLPVRSKHAQVEVLLLCWVVPYFIVTGGFHVKFMRYMLPIAPLLTLFGARLLWALWDVATAQRIAWINRDGRGWQDWLARALRPLSCALIALVLAGAAFYALAYLNGVYGQTHTAVRASEWLNRSAPHGATVLKEHWEESLPNQRRDFRFGELPMYENDRYAKTAHIAESLADADYLVFFSNRLYGTIPRLPERYPISTSYYNLLFAEQLGYTLENVQTSYPDLFGIAFADDTLGRPKLSTPPALQRHTTSPVALKLGWADESFSVYDHPKVLIFRNTGRLGAEEIQRLIEQSAPSDAYDLPARERRPSPGLVYSPEDLAIQQSGGTWTSIIHTDSWTNRLPVLAWLGVLELIALAALPLTFVVFRPLSDRGYLFGKVLGLLLVGLIVWLLASTQLMAFSRSSIVLALLLLGMASLGVFAVRGDEIIDFVRMRWRALVVAEVVFIAAFLVFVLVRMANPDLWHPFRGGEKPMDFAYLNAVLRSTIMPPYDPWFGGGYLNYYYWGQFLTALLVRATAIEPVVAFNLAVPTFFALTAGGVYTKV
ncbi:MAG: phospholipid carrier-dependent glycosyltransferase [Chloroflexi bacterium]|nr:phospholipid carrier-dependent glycosyltransferase [Chloroflexota bacterium]